MRSLKGNPVIFILLAGVLSACGSISAGMTTASPPTENASTPTRELTNTPAPTATTIPTRTAIPTPTVRPTESPAIRPTGQIATASFANDVLPIFKSRCSNCHGGQKTEENLNLLSYADLMKGSDNGPVLIPGDVENSLLADMISSQEMPKRGPKLTPPQIQLIVDWINEGALDN